ncbi:MAG TPA: TetR/AcrR family transcriptional regulator [Steroidobacteraceae bacterium]|nr:TetR/AcrR family transcriptional regulator [Steroidobacteraceae bacterium]
MKPVLSHESTANGGNVRARQLAARREQLIAVAEHLFLEHGFANTSVNAIVREAGGSLATLYSEFGSKEALFESVLSERAARFFPEDRSAPCDTPDATIELRALATQMLKRMLSEDGLAVYRIAVHEAPRFPALRKALLEVGMPGLLERTARYLRALADRGALQIEESPQAARLAASRFIALVQGQLVFSAACGGEVSARTRTAHVSDAIVAFLSMYGKPV